MKWLLLLLLFSGCGSLMTTQNTVWTANWYCPTGEEGCADHMGGWNGSVSGFVDQESCQEWLKQTVVLGNCTD